MSYDLTLWRLTRTFQKESRNVQATFVIITYRVMEVSETGQGKVKRPLIILTSLEIDDVQTALAKERKTIITACARHKSIQGYTQKSTRET